MLKTILEQQRPAYWWDVPPGAARDTVIRAYAKVAFMIANVFPPARFIIFASLRS